MPRNQRWSTCAAGLVGNLAVLAAVLLSACSSDDDRLQVVDTTTSSSSTPQSSTTLTSVPTSAVTTAVASSTVTSSTASTVPVGPAPLSPSSSNGPGSPTTKPIAPGSPTTAPAVRPTITAPRPTPPATPPPAPRAQTIAFPSPAGGQVKFALGRTVALQASATSGLPVAYRAVGFADICNVSGSTVRVTSVGPCTIEATQPGNSAWLPAPAVEATFQILDGDSSFTMATSGSASLSAGTHPVEVTDVLGSQVFNVSTEGTCSFPAGFFLATSSRRFAVNLDAAGTCQIAVSQQGTQTWASSTPKIMLLTIT